MKQDSQTICGVFSVNEFCSWAGMGRTSVYAKLKAGRLDARRFGRRTLIFKSEAER
ncbi:MAG: helix-turn-helix domain-containing protein [Betaproteobacteria bacterium]|nr:helix-turn-helix domain-containing protein [Betaproteobacteria bacterium]